MKMYPGFSERVIHFLMVLRELPYLTSADFIRYFYPANKNKTYALDTLRILCRRNLVEKYRLNDGSFIYFLTREGVKESEGLAAHKQTFHRQWGCMFVHKEPRFEREKPSFIFHPAPYLDFRCFSPIMLSSYQFLHTRGLTEFVYLVRKAHIVSYSICLDMILNKKSNLKLTNNPDILLTNDLQDTEIRVLIEFENSNIWEKGLIEKLNSLSKQTADIIIFLCANDIIFRNMGWLLNKISSGRMVKDGVKWLPSQATISSLERRMFFGIWRPSYSNNGEIQKLEDTVLYPHNSRALKRAGWVQKVVDNALVSDEHSNSIMALDDKIPIEDGIPFLSLFEDSAKEYKANLLRLSNGNKTDSVL